MNSKFSGKRKIFWTAASERRKEPEPLETPFARKNRTESEKLRQDSSNCPHVCINWTGCQIKHDKRKLFCWDFDVEGQHTNCRSVQPGLEKNFWGTVPKDIINIVKCRVPIIPGIIHLEPSDTKNAAENGEDSPARWHIFSIRRYWSHLSCQSKVRNFKKVICNQQVLWKKEQVTKSALKSIWPHNGTYTD